MATIPQVFRWFFHEFLGKEDADRLRYGWRKVRVGDGMGDMEVLAGSGRWKDGEMLQ